MREEKRKRDDSILTEEEQKILRVHLAAFVSGNSIIVSLIAIDAKKYILFPNQNSNIHDFLACINNGTGVSFGQK